MVVSVHNASMDPVVPAAAKRSFLRCCTCGVYSSFFIYLGYNDKSIKFRPEAKHLQLFCPVCSPDPGLFQEIFPGSGSLFRPDSILNDRRLLDLLKVHVYDEDNPNEIIIITENSQLCSPYKAVAKRVAPKSSKLQWLMRLFPDAHRMPSKDIASEDDLAETMAQKYHEICVSYMDISETAGGSQLIDNFDIMIDKTPLVVAVQRRQHSRIAVPVVIAEEEDPAEASPGRPPVVLLNDSDREIRAGSDSDDESDLASIGSVVSRGILATASDISVGNEVQISSEEPAGHWDVQPSSQSQSQHSSQHQSSSQLAIAAGRSASQSQSVDISSQSVNRHSDISYGSDSSESAIIAMPPPRAARRRTPSADDGQQPGPSGVKRRRVSPRGNRPVNPTPEEFQRNPQQYQGRLPRTDGG